MQTQTVAFTFEYIGAEWAVTATFERYSSTPSADHDDEWQIKEIEVIGDDDQCWYLEMREVLDRKFGSDDMVSIASLIEEKAFGELE